MANTTRSHGLKDGKTTKPCRSCENHGGCPVCEGNRLHKHRRQALVGTDEDLGFYGVMDLLITRKEDK